MLEASDCHAAARVPPAAHFQARAQRRAARREQQASRVCALCAALTNVHTSVAAHHTLQSPPRGAVPATYELRTYQLILGYNPVPELRAAFCEGCVLRGMCSAAASERADTC